MQDQLKTQVFEAEGRAQRATVELQNYQAQVAPAVAEAAAAVETARSEAERYKRLAEQHQKQIGGLQTRLEQTEARARKGAAQADTVEQLGAERDQVSKLLKKRRFLYKELEFQLTVIQATIDAECELPTREAADAVLRELHMRVQRIEERRRTLLP